MPGAGVRQHHIEIFKRKYKIGFMIKDKKKKKINKSWIWIFLLTKKINKLIINICVEENSTPLIFYNIVKCM